MRLAAISVVHVQGSQLRILPSFYEVGGVVACVKFEIHVIDLWTAAICEYWGKLIIFFFL